MLPGSGPAPAKSPASPGRFKFRAGDQQPGLPGLGRREQAGRHHRRHGLGLHEPSHSDGPMVRLLGR